MMRSLWAVSDPDSSKAKLSWRRLSALMLLIIGLMRLLAVQAWAAKHEKIDSPPPAIRIPTEQLGYHPASSFYLMARFSSASLDFIDSEHLLFTFRVPGLLQRLPGCQPDDEDQLIRALVIHLPDGAVERSADWRMHDRGRYLWRLRGGRFLLRQRDTLQTTDATLELKPYLQARMPIRLIELSPDARLLLIETDLEKHDEEEHRKLVENANLKGLSPPREDVQMSILRVEDRSVLARARALNPGELPLIGTGFLETLTGKKDHWLVRYQPLEGEPSTMADLASSCRPVETPLNQKAAFVSTCAPGGERFIQVMTVDGKELWRYRWDAHYIWPTSSVSDDGSRIAMSNLRLNHEVNAMDPISEDGSDFQAQRIEVLDTETGQVALTQFASPILSGGQNFALSPDGRRFGVLRDNSIQIYDLPAAPLKHTAAE